MARLYLLESAGQVGIDAGTSAVFIGSDSRCFEKRAAYQGRIKGNLPQEHLRKIFNLAGIVMPALLVNGQVAGKWKQKNGKLSVELFRDISKTEETRIKEKAEILWNGLKKIEL